MSEESKEKPAGRRRRGWDANEDEEKKSDSTKSTTKSADAGLKNLSCSLSSSVVIYFLYFRSG